LIKFHLIWMFSKFQKVEYKGREIEQSIACKCIFKQAMFF
jgi:hypothetical protein